MVETVVTVERTTTTTTGPPGGVNPAPNGGGFWSAIRLNLDYFRTIPGILKIVQLVSTLSLYIQYMYIHMYIYIFYHAHMAWKHPVLPAHCVYVALDVCLSHILESVVCDMLGLSIERFYL